MRTFVDLVQVNTTSAGTGAFALGSAVTGFFGVEALTDGATYSYSVQQGGNAEWGSGTFTAATGTLTRTVARSTNGNAPVAFDVGAVVSFTFTSADIADLLSEAGGVAATAKTAFNAYGLQWGVWFNATPAAGELLALYSVPVAMQFPVNFAGSATAPPITSPAASYTLNADQQAGGTGTWTTIGTITLGTDGSVALATIGNAAVSVAVGDRLRLIAPATADTAVAGFSATLKGFIP